MNIADSTSLSAIYKTLKNDPCEIVRHEAAFVLGETASRESIINLKTAVIEDLSVIVKHEGLLALGTIANKEVIPFLEEQKKSRISLIRESAKIALERINYFPKPYRGPEEFKHLK